MYSTKKKNFFCHDMWIDGEKNFHSWEGTDVFLSGQNKIFSTLNVLYDDGY